MIKLMTIIFLVLLRFVLGAFMLAAGIEKLLDISDYQMIFEASPLPSLFAHLMAIVETLVGLMLLFGFFVRSSVLVLMISLVLAIFLVPYQDALFVNDYMQISLLLIIGMILLVTKNHPFSMMGNLHAELKEQSNEKA